jgi:RHS repeat-associated protein
VVRRYTTPFGDARGAQASWTGDHGFLDKPVDATGLVAIGARYYDPGLGKFISVDPVMDLGNPQQWSAYAYGNNNPVTWADPTGELLMGAGHTGYNPQTDKSGGDPCAKANSCVKTVREERTGKSVKVRYNYTDRAVRYFAANPDKSYADVQVDRTYKKWDEREKSRENGRKKVDAKESGVDWNAVENYAGIAATGLAMLTPVCPVCGLVGAGISVGLAVVDIAQGDGASAALNLVSAATFGVGGALMRGSRLAMTSARTVFPARNAARAAGQPYLKVRDATAAFRRREAASVSLRRASHYADEVLFHPHGAFAGVHMTATGTLSYLSNRE